MPSWKNKKSPLKEGGLGGLAKNYFFQGSPFLATYQATPAPRTPVAKQCSKHSIINLLKKLILAHP